MLNFLGEVADMNSVRYTTTATLEMGHSTATGTCFGNSESRSMEFPQEMTTSVDLGMRAMRPANDSTLLTEFPRPVYAGSAAAESE
jgi:hypothetical protein